MDRIESPEQLTDYLHVTNPGVWALIALILLLLAGFFAWGTIGRLETTAKASVAVSDGSARIMLADGAPTAPVPGMTVKAGNGQFTVTEVKEDDSGRITAYADVTLANGIYDAEIVLESISPIRFLFGI